ncbi:MAG: extracellular solute-binding protein, partial [Pseudomonadota bacterium]
TADDVAFTFETLQAEGSPTYQIRLKDLEAVTVLSEREVRVDFVDNASTRDLISDIGQIEILPRHFYDENVFDEATLDPPLGSGPYVVDEIDAGRFITYCRNPDYWAADLAVNVGKDNFECYRYEYFADTTAAFEALKAGVYLFHEEFFSVIWATGYDFPALENGWVVRETIPDNRPAGSQGFWFNLRKPKFQDRRVREAIGYLFNFEWSNESLFYGLYSRTNSFWEGSDMEAGGIADGPERQYLEQFASTLPSRILSDAAVEPPVSSSRVRDRAAIRSAIALLEDAGWTIGPDGVRRNADGEALTIEFIDDSPAFERIILPFVENLKAAGIDAKFDLIDAAQMQERQDNFDYDIVIARFALPLSPSIELRTLFGSESAQAPGTFNLSGVADPVVDEMIEDVIAAPDRETLKSRVRALDRVLRDKLIWVPQWSKGEHWIAYWDVFGRPDVKPTYDRGIDYWWWEQDKFDALQAVGALR